MLLSHTTRKDLRGIDGCEEVSSCFVSKADFQSRVGPSSSVAIKCGVGVQFDENPCSCQCPVPIFSSHRGFAFTDRCAWDVQLRVKKDAKLDKR
jgi:hypothetical protein